MDKTVLFSPSAASFDSLKILKNVVTILIFIEKYFNKFKHV